MHCEIQPYCGGFLSQTSEHIYVVVLLKPGADELPHAPSGSLGSSQPSSSTLGSWPTQGSAESNISVNVQGAPVRNYLQAVPENADAVRIPAELEPQERVDASRISIAVPPPQYQASQQDVRHPLTEEEAQFHAAARQNDAVNLRKRSEAEEKRILDRQYNASADNVRRLRELIRERYALDIFVWSKRKITRRLVANRKTIIPSYRKSDAILQEIYFIVNAWEEDLFTPEEWKLAKNIKMSLLNKQLENGVSNEPAIWDSLPPWEREDDTAPVDDMARLNVSPTQRGRPPRPLKPVELRSP